ncbi:MAG: DUF1513 domain-containing protein [Rhodobacteraceae bacterium]|nr:DUF1513 domain-containing protein [Paracoccaceae bacterium]
MPARRSFLVGLLSAGLAPRLSWADAGSPAFLSAARTPAGRYVLCGLSEAGSISFQIPIPDRGHAAAAHPTKPQAVAFARRPGTFALVVNCATGEVDQRLYAPEGRHFYGHGAFAEGGDILLTTENDYEAGRGMLGLWDARNGYARMGEITSGGVGPHDMKLMSDGRLAVANGGIETHPETGRTKLNLATMQPNLSYVSLDGVVSEVVELNPALRRNSIRHLAVDGRDRVGMAMQWQGDVADSVPLVAVHDARTGKLMLGAAQDQRSLLGYAGSIAMAGETVAVTSPKGGIAQTYSLEDFGLLNQVERPDICGVAAIGAEYVTTTGSGLFENHSGRPKRTQTRLNWDNHLVSLVS